MKHTAAEDIAWTDAPSENFTGQVHFGPLASPIVDGALNALGVLFAPGARTDWHTHPEGQVMYIASGAGLVQNESGETAEVSAGDVVTSPPGEVHWHGATRDSYMMHLSLTTGGPTEWVPRKVSDEEYSRR